MKRSPGAVPVDAFAAVWLTASDPVSCMVHDFIVACFSLVGILVKCIGLSSLSNRSESTCYKSRSHAYLRAAAQKSKSLISLLPGRGLAHTLCQTVSH